MARVLTATVLRSYNTNITSGVVVKPQQLDSALSRPTHTKRYEPERPETYLAATLAWGLINGHPFLDGNKRTAEHAAKLYLGDNYVVKEGKEADMTAAHTRVASADMTVEQLAAVYAEAFAKTT